MINLRDLLILNLTLQVFVCLCDDERIKAYASITLDDCFIIHGLRLTHSAKKAIFFSCRVERRLTANT